MQWNKLYWELLLNLSMINKLAYYGVQSLPLYSLVSSYVLQNGVMQCYTVNVSNPTSLWAYLCQDYPRFSPYFPQIFQKKNNNPIAILHLNRIRRWSNENTKMD